MDLDQRKLDAIDKKRSNSFNWRGQFTPEFIEYLLDIYSKPNNVIADPFSGSGTVLSEAIRKNLSCIGYEVNPSAYYMSKFYEYAKCTSKEREDIVNVITIKVNSALKKIPANQPLYIDGGNYMECYQNLLKFATTITEKTDEYYLSFILNVLFLSEKDKKMSIEASIKKSMAYVSGLLMDLPYTQCNIIAKLGDARNMGVEHKNEVDLIITSPPYINVFNYHQNYRGIIECLGFNVLKVAESEIGSNRKHRSNRFKTVVQYAIDMGHTIYNTSFALKKGGKMVFIVGRVSTVRKTPFYNSEIIRDIVSAIPSLEIESWSERQFGNRYGECIKEDIICISKNSLDRIIDLSVFEQIGMKHIEAALQYAPNEMKEGLLSILNKKESIFESPIYNKLCN